MSSHTTTTPAYVRTAAGVVMVDAGEHVPDDVLPSERERLTAAGIIRPDHDSHAGASPADLGKPKRATKTELQAEASALGLSTDGTAKQLADRIAAAKA